MSTVIDSMFISLGVDPQRVSEGMDKADSIIRNSFQHIASFIAPVLGALSFGAITKDYLAMADSMGRFSESIGANIEDVHAWGEAVHRFGGDIKSFQGTLSTLTSNLTHIATTGNSRIKPFFDELGISAVDANGKIRQAFQILPELAEKFEQMSKPESLGFGQKIGLDHGTIVLLQSGKKAVEELIRKQKEFGVYTKEDALITAKMNDALANMGQAFKAMSAIFLRVAVPALNVFVDILTKMIVWVKQNQTFVLTFVSLLAAAISVKLLPVLFRLAAAGIASIRSWWPLIATISGVALVIDDLIFYINGGESALAKFWALFGTGEEISANLTKALEFLQSTLRRFKGTVVTLTAAFVGLKLVLRFFALSNPIIAVILAIATAVGLVIDNIDLLKEKFYEFIGWAKNLWSTVKGWFGFDDSKAQGIENAVKNLKPLDSTLSISSNIRNRPNNINNDTDISISNLTINTKATDSVGIARDFNSALSRELSRGLAFSSNTGVVQK